MTEEQHPRPEAEVPTAGTPPESAVTETGAQEPAAEPQNGPVPAPPPAAEDTVADTETSSDASDSPEPAEATAAVPEPADAPQASPESVEETETSGDEPAEATAESAESVEETETSGDEPADETVEAPEAADAPETSEPAADARATPDPVVVATSSDTASSETASSDTATPEATEAPAETSTEATAEPADETVEAPEAPAETSTESEPAAKAPVPKPSAVPKPSVLAKPGPRPAAPHAPAPGATPSPAATATSAAPGPQTNVGGAEAPLDPAEVEAATAFGRVDSDGTVHVLEAAGERVVGQYPGVPDSEAMALYIRRYIDLKAQVDLFAARLDQLSAKDLDATLANLTEAVAEPAVVGDVDALRTQVSELGDRVTVRKEHLAAEREAAKERAAAERTVIVEKAEKIAARNPAKIQWRQEGQRLRELLEEWKQAQRSGPRLDRGTEDALWKRFSAARTSFDRSRRQHFAELDSRHAEVKATKERLIIRAEALSSSRDWGATSAAYRDLMDEWKRAGRAARKDDDALWARFRAAQDVFFEARNAQNAATDAEYAQNLQVKLELLTEAEALLPIKDLNAAKAALRAIQDRWEEAGKVPRADVQRVEGRMRAVETAIRDREQAQWNKSNPRVRARAEGAAAQLEAAIAGLEADLAKAEQSGDARRIKDATDALAARKAWLEQVQRAAEDAS